jgi:serine/threonine-protein phosphatase 2B catalytic subunit
MTLGQTQLERAIYEVQNRATVPQLDFTQHQLENGNTVSTQERVVKEVCLTVPPLLVWMLW